MIVLSTNAVPAEARAEAVSRADKARPGIAKLSAEI